MSLFQPTNDLNVILREFGITTLNSTTPPAPDGRSNVTWHTDMYGNISASVPTSQPFEPSGPYSSATIYSIGQVVSYNGGSYVSSVNDNLNNQPDISPDDWQLLASPGGGVSPGTQFQLPFYASTGSSVSPTNITTTADGSQFIVPGEAFLKQNTLAYNYTGPSGSTALYATNGVHQFLSTLNIQGPGWSLGNAGVWSTGATCFPTFNVATRGIHQAFPFIITKHAVGDTAGIYGYVHSDGGGSAQSDEGVSGVNVEVTEPSTYFHGSIASTSGTGDQAPALSYTTGSNWTTDGAFLLNITKGTLSGNLNGNSVALSLTTNAGAQSTYLSYLPVTGVSLPVSTAIGIVTASIVNQAVTANAPVPVTLTITLCQINGTFPLFTEGSVVTVAGNWYPEQSIITTAVNNHDGTQTLTLNLHNPNDQAIIFQGGIQGQYISFDANLALSGMRSSYYAFGSINGSDLIYGVNAGGSVGSLTLPQVGNEAATPTGANSGFHLYPGAEVVCNTNQGFSCTLEQNGVVWAVDDVIENPHYPVQGGITCQLSREQHTPTPISGGVAGIQMLMSGPGISGNNSVFAAFINQNTASIYQSNGGPLFAPAGIRFTGNFNHYFDLGLGPSGGNVINIEGPSNPSDTTINLIGIDTAGGLFSFDITNQRYQTANFHTGLLTATTISASSGFSSAGVAGTTGTFTIGSSTVVIKGGIVTSVT